MNLQNNPQSRNPKERTEEGLGKGVLGFLAALSNHRHKEVPKDQFPHITPSKHGHLPQWKKEKLNSKLKKKKKKKRRMAKRSRRKNR